jgi:ubiquinone/menaquinone biosynthesis C-methylase UbiE
MGLRFSYTLLSPIYDALLSRASQNVRRDSLSRVELAPGKRVLISGIGSGLDIPLLPTGPEFTGIDLTPAMLRRAAARARESALNIRLDEGNAMSLPYQNESYDLVIMHLILAVVPVPVLALQEAQRVLRPGGQILVLDKFLRPGQKALFRRAINPLISRVATRTDVVFEELLAQCAELQVLEDTPTRMSNWFRHILLEKSDKAQTTQTSAGNRA